MTGIIISNISFTNTKGNIIGAPSDAYTYGTLMTFLTHKYYYMTSQIYIPHSNKEFYVRTLADGIYNNPETTIGNCWKKVSCTSVDSTA